MVSSDKRYTWELWQADQQFTHHLNTSQLTLPQQHDEGERKRTENVLNSAPEFNQVSFQCKNWLSLLWRVQFPFQISKKPQTNISYSFAFALCWSGKNIKIKYWISGFSLLNALAGIGADVRLRSGIECAKPRSKGPIGGTLCDRTGDMLILLLPHSLEDLLSNLILFAWGGN